MRIGEVGVSTRAVRHYHQRGLLPEPARLANGYREYALTDVVTLARIRRLTELGLTLDEVRDALGDIRDLREILVELDPVTCRSVTRGSGCLRCSSSPGCWCRGGGSTGRAQLSEPVDGVRQVRFRADEPTALGLSALR